MEILGLHAALDIPHISQLYMVYRARLVGTHFGPGEESSEVKLVDLADIPWTDLAFPSVATALRLYAADRAAGTPRAHMGTLPRNGQGARCDIDQYALPGHLAR